MTLFILRRVLLAIPTLLIISITLGVFQEHAPAQRGRDADDALRQAST